MMETAGDLIQRLVTEQVEKRRRVEIGGLNALTKKELVDELMLARGNIDVLETKIESLIKKLKAYK